MRNRSLLLLIPVFLFSLSLAAQMPATPPGKATAPSADAAKTITIYLVRHAEKAGSTGDVELSEAGTKRAACLATTLAEANIQSIFTTEYKRTKNTAVPMAEKSGVTPTVIGGGEMDKLIAALQNETGKNVLVVGHSNTVPKIVERLGGGTVTIKDEDYDHLYIVTLRNGEASRVSLHYCP